MRQLEAEVRDTAIRLGCTATVREVIGKRCSDKPYAEHEQEAGRPCVVPHR